jgi:hypothetical protein
VNAVVTETCVGWSRVRQVFEEYSSCSDVTCVNIAKVKDGLFCLSCRLQTYGNYSM